MVVLVTWIAVVAASLVTLAALALGLSGHVRRFLRAARAAEGDLGPLVRALEPRLAELSAPGPGPGKSVMDDPVQN